MKYLDKLTDEDLEDLCKEILELEWWTISRRLTDFKVDRKSSDTYEIQGDYWDKWEDELVEYWIHYYLNDFFVDVGDTEWLKDDDQATTIYRKFMTEKFGKEYAEDAKKYDDLRRKELEEEKGELKE